MALLTVMKGLPLTYTADLQEDKEAVFDAMNTLHKTLSIMTRMIPSIEVHQERMREATQEGFLEATDLADYLAQKGVAFRSAHEVVGRAVLYCLKSGKRLPELSLGEFQSFSPLFKRDVFAVLNPRAIVQRRDTPGGTAPNRVRAALRRAKRSLR
jgi:argininosuccinate lyase